MRLHRFISPLTIEGEKVVLEDKEKIQQISTVLRLKEGNQILLCDGISKEYTVTIESISKNVLRGVIEHITTIDTALPKKIELFCSMLKKENFELVVQKATEIGVTSITPIITSRTIKTGFNEERILKIALEASEQSGRLTVPFINPPLSFEEGIILSKKNDNSLFFEKDGTTTFQEKKSHSLGIWIGPEGGWTQEEKELALQNNFILASLGNTTLRAETAAIIATYVALHSK